MFCGASGREMMRLAAWSEILVMSERTYRAAKATEHTVILNQESWAMMVITTSRFLLGDRRFGRGGRKRQA